MSEQYRAFTSTCHHLTQRNLTPRIQHKFPISLVTWTNKFPTAWTKIEREREREEKSFEPGLSKGSRGLVGGCYDVLRCVVATKTMWLVTVIVRNVGLCAATNPVHRPRLRSQPFPRFPRRSLRSFVTTAPPFSGSTL